MFRALSFWFTDSSGSPSPSGGHATAGFPTASGHLPGMVASLQINCLISVVLLPPVWASLAFGGMTATGRVGRVAGFPLHPQQHPSLREVTHCYAQMTKDCQCGARSLRDNCHLAMPVPLLPPFPTRIKLFLTGGDHLYHSYSVHALRHS